MSTSTPSVIGEFDGAHLGDERLHSRLLAMVESLARDPELSFPEALGRGAGLEGGYRFLNNERVAAAELLTPHIEATAARLAAHKRVLVVHDTTEFAFKGRVAREGFEGHKFHAHFSLAVSADGRREPLGVLAIKPWMRAEKKAVVSTKERRLDGNRESKRWLEQSLVVENAVDAVDDGVQLIHVEDREGCIFESLAARVKRGMHFIVRAQKQRAVEVGNERINILEHMRKQDTLFRRTVTLSRRHLPARHGNHQTYGPRDGRTAQLAMSAARVSMQVPCVDIGASEVEPFEVNVVRVVEIDPPEGEEVVEWLLMTSEPIATEADIAFVVDSYRARWVIEEYFKALKTGCAYEARQLEGYDALLRALSIFSVIAWRLLWMRFLSHHAPKTPATAFATKTELDVLVAQKRVKPGATVEEFLHAIADIGGHLKHNGPPGWQVLWRGYRTLRVLAAGFELAHARSDQW